MSPAALDIAISVTSLVLAISYLAAIPVVILRLPIATYLRVAFAATLVLWSASYAVSALAGLSGELGLTEEQPDLYAQGVAVVTLRLTLGAIVWAAMLLFYYDRRGGRRF